MKMWIDWIISVNYNSVAPTWECLVVAIHATYLKMDSCNRKAEHFALYNPTKMILGGIIVNLMLSKNGWKPCSKWFFTLASKELAGANSCLNWWMDQTNHHVCLHVPSSSKGPQLGSGLIWTPLTHYIFHLGWPIQVQAGLGWKLLTEIQISSG